MPTFADARHTPRRSWATTAYLFTVNTLALLVPAAATSELPTIPDSTPTQRGTRSTCEATGADKRRRPAHDCRRLGGPTEEP